jgi:hypothetical protein
MVDALAEAETETEAAAEAEAEVAAVMEAVPEAEAEAEAEGSIVDGPETETGTETETEIETETETETETATESNAPLPSPFAELMASRLQSSGQRFPSGTLEALQGLDIPGLGEEAAPPRGRPQQGPYAVRAVRPPGPTLHPLALAFLASELACRTETGLRQASETYCSYLSNACGGLRVELWFESEGYWLCGATHDGSEGRFRSAVELAGGGEREPGSTVGLIVSLDGKRHGALVLHGERADALDRDFLALAARMAVGMAMSWAEQHAGKAPQAA